MTERDLDVQVRALLRSLPQIGKRYHAAYSLGSEAGYPDWTFIGPHGVMWRELKRENGRVTPAQQAWLDALTAAGMDAAVWRPSDLIGGRVGRELLAFAGLPAALVESELGRGAVRSQGRYNALGRSG